MSANSLMGPPSPYLRAASSLSSSSEDLTQSSLPVNACTTKTNLGWIAHLEGSSPLDPQMHFTAGTMYWIYKRYAQAAEHYEKGFKSVLSNPGYTFIGHPIFTYHERAAQCYLALKQYREASNHFGCSLAHELAPSDEATAERHITAAKCCLAIDDYIQAANHFKSALGFYHDLKRKNKTTINLNQLRIDTAHACLRAKEYATAATIFEDTIQSLRKKKRKIPITVYKSSALANYFDNQHEKAIAFFEHYQKRCRKQGLPVSDDHVTFFALSH